MIGIDPTSTTHQVGTVPQVQQLMDTQNQKHAGIPYICQQQDTPTSQNYMYKVTRKNKNKKEYKKI